MLPLLKQFLGYESGVRHRPRVPRGAGLWGHQDASADDKSTEDDDRGPKPATAETALDFVEYLAYRVLTLSPR